MIRVSSESEHLEQDVYLPARISMNPMITKILPRTKVSQARLKGPNRQ